MKNTKDMIKEESIWAGLNQPNLPTEEADIVVFGIPFDGGVSFRGGAKDGPRALREITYTIAPTTEHFESIADLKIVDKGDISGENRDEIFKEVEETVCELVKKGKFFTMIGGDHSTTIPVQRGIDKALDESFGIIHIDAHFDLCDRLEGDELSHGSTERRALELKNVPDSESIFFIGIRSIEMDELEFMKENKINVVNSYEFNKIGVEKVLENVKEKMKRFNKIYLTLDIDCLDPAYAAGTGTPQFGGLNSRQLLDLLRGLFDLPIIGFDIVEVAPNLDPALTSLFAARKIITECWGHQRRKNC
ncbi:agmatinase [Wukongibacter baidiensis]|uniref:agmatinase n=1 Tax=Wukongibacter baidiensis TaxID=1723361 RepID=UPI003D7FF1B8